MSVNTLHVLCCRRRSSRLFGALALSTQEFHSPEGFWRSFKDYDGEPINVCEHQVRRQSKAALGTRASSDRSPCDVDVLLAFLHVL